MDQLSTVRIERREVAQICLLLDWWNHPHFLNGLMLNVALMKCDHVNVYEYVMMMRRMMLPAVVGVVVHGWRIPLPQSKTS